MTTGDSKQIEHYLHIHSGRMRADLPHPIYFHQKAYWISDLRDNRIDCTQILI